MILKYVLSNFSRRKVRTILMVLALMVSTGLIATMSATVATVRRSNVDLIASAVGRYDLAVSKTDTSPDPFISISEVAPIMLAADDRITAVYPRIRDAVELSAKGSSDQLTMIALDPEVDEVGYIDLVEGSYTIGDGKVALLEGTALTRDIRIGDRIDLSYSFPVPREVGHPAAAGASERRTTRSFTVGAIVRQDGVTGGLGRDGLIAHLEDVQDWLALPGRSTTLIATVNPALYETNNAETAALRIRDVVRSVQAQLGNEYQYSLEKAQAIGEAAQAFLIVQALINIYGLIALGVVGLLIYTLVMTNVQEQRRDMAILRILGSKRRYLFSIVISEVLVIGLIGVGLGIVTGELITQFIVVPIIQDQMAGAGIPTPLTPEISVQSLMPVIAAAFIVLIISSLKPARDAANTKVMHAINPSVADNIQIEDLARIRERRPDFKMFLAGLALMAIFALIAGFQVIENFGGPALQVTFVLLAIGLLVLGLGLMFYIATVPFERLVLTLMGTVAPRLTFFARRNVGRGQLRNTLISLLVLFSAVLPSFLATTLALDQKNFEATIRQDMGAPAEIRVAAFWSTPEEAERYRLTTTFRTRDVAQLAGVEKTAGMTYPYRSFVSDSVGFRSASAYVIGLDGSLKDVIFRDLVQFLEGGSETGSEALDRLQVDTDAVIISEGLANYLVVSAGDRLRISGEGSDHFINPRVTGIARKIPGIDGIDRSRTLAQSDSTILMSSDTFRSLVVPLDLPPVREDGPIYERILLTTSPEADVREMQQTFGEKLARDYRIWIRFLTLQVEENQRGFATVRIFLLALTTIAFTTAVFGVFAVIYVTIYARRIEIGMMKAMGMKRREITGMLNLESIAMTLGAALAGITAGAAMGYVAFYGQRALSQQPSIFAVDTVVMPFIVIMMVLASLIGATFSARRIVKKRAVEILRMQ